MKRTQIYAFALYFSALWVAILLPLDFQWPEAVSKTLRAELFKYDLGGISILNYAGHAILFLPLGAVLESKIVYREFDKAYGLAALIITLAALSELSQVFVANRGPNLIDFVMDIVGVSLGFVVIRQWRYSSRWQVFTKWCLAPWAILLGIISTSLVIIFLLVPIDTGFSNWDPSFHLLFGNEKTRDRPWRGALYEVMLLDRPLSEAEARLLSIRPISINQRTDARSILRYSFSAPELQLKNEEVRAVLEISGLEPAIDLRVQGPGKVVPIIGGGIQTDGKSFLISDVMPHRVFKRITKSGTFTLIVRFRAIDFLASGPARIVSLSADHSRRNFTLGQVGDALVFRVRNLISGDNGNRPELIAKGCVQPGSIQTVIAVSAGSTSRLYIDGNPCGNVLFFTLLGEFPLLFLASPSSMAGILFLGWVFFSLPFYFLLGPFFTTNFWRELTAAIFSATIVGVIFGVNYWFRNY